MKPIRIGVVGCGAIAQVHHLPNLMMLDQEFEVAGLCDISPTLARTIAEDYGVAFHTSDYRELLAADLEAVLLCHSDPKTEAALAAFEAGKHVLIEKPLCFSLADIDAVTAAVQASGKVGMAAYMKVYDPAYEIAWREVERMSSIRFVQINHLHTGNEFHLRHLRLKRFDDRPAVPGGTVGDIARDVLGDGVPAAAASAFRTVAGSMIHDIYGLRLMMGPPQRVVSTEIWNQGRGINTVLAYESGARCAASWVSLPGLWNFTETLEVYAEDRRVMVNYPSGFARGIPSRVAVHGVDGEGRTFCKEPAVEWDNAFLCEMRHFHSCITGSVSCRTPVEDARHDIALVIDIVKAYLDK
jgi:predicted dehydrogenase